MQLTTALHEISVRRESENVVTADRDHLEQVLNNLVTNAIKYSPTGGAITMFHANSVSLPTLIVRGTDSRMWFISRGNNLIVVSLHECGFKLKVRKLAACFVDDGSGRLHTILDLSVDFLCPQEVRHPES